jgi:hypothetical protein
MSDERYAWEGKKGMDEVGAKELYLFITNDSDLYRQQYEPINKNLTIKKARGVYDHAKAAKLFGYLVETGAKWYENGGRPSYGKPQHIPSYFSKKLRDAVAEELRDNFEIEHALGNYDNYIPKKYQATSKPKAKSRRRTSDNPTAVRGMRR